MPSGSWAALAGAFAGVAMLAGCGSGESDPAGAEAGAANVSGVAPGDPPVAAEFLRLAGEDIEACFAEIPELVGAGDRESFAGPQGLPAGEAANRVVVAIDASGSMAGRIGGQTKMDAAKAAATEFLAGVPEGTQVGLVAFGHRGDNSDAGRATSCRGVDTVYPVGAADRARLGQALAGFDATGWTPLADAIARAGESFTPSDRPGAQIVYVVSDGLETCGGDPVAAARGLHGGPVKAIVNVIGFDLAAADRAQLRAVAEAGGGRFIEVNNAAELRRAAVAESRRVVTNLMALARSATDTNLRLGRNNTGTNQLIGRLNLCVNQSVSREFYRFNTADAGPGFGATPFRAAPGLREWLSARHAGYHARKTAAGEQIRAAREVVNEDVRQQMNETRSDYEATR